MGLGVGSRRCTNMADVSIHRAGTDNQRVAHLYPYISRGGKSMLYWVISDLGPGLGIGIFLLLAREPYTLSWSDLSEVLVSMSA